MEETEFEYEIHNLTDVYNASVPFDHGFDEASLKLLAALRLLRNIGIPLISIFGIFGNALSLVVFSAKSMKNSSCTVFLAALAFVDNLFLFCLVTLWIDSEYYPLMRYDFCCQLLIFFSYVSSFLSVWFIVSFTFERFIAICFPLKISYMCSIFREKVAVLVLSVLSCVLYNFSFWTNSLQFDGQRMRCYHKMEFFDFLETVIWIDSFITMVIPFLFITVMNTIVLYTVRKCPKKTKAQRTYISNPSVSHRDKVQNQAKRSFSVKVKKVKKVRASPHVRVTRTLLLVSTTFLCLNLPSHAMRLYNLFIATITPQRTEISLVYGFVHEVTLMLYYSTFSCNFILYTAFGRNFQNSLKEIIRCRPSMNYHRVKMLQRLSSTRGSLITSL